MSCLCYASDGSSVQAFGFSEEQSFTTGPAPGSDETVKLLAIADLGFCEEDGSMTYAGSYPNPIATLPVGTAAEIKQEVRIFLHSPYPRAFCAQQSCRKRLQACYRTVPKPSS